MASRYSSCGGSDCQGIGAPCRQMAATASEEKREMQALNDKLASYMQRMRSLGQQVGGQIDPKAYHEIIRTLEGEIGKLRNMYENELDKLRRQLEEATRDKSGIAANCTKIQTMAGDLQTKLASEADKTRRNAQDLANCQGLLSQREKELADLRAMVQALQSELDRLKPDHARLCSDYEQLKRRLEDEVQRRLNAEGQAKQWNDKVNFDANARGQECQELRERLKASNDIIVTLETKINQLSKADGNNMGNILQKLRDANAAELRRYQQETAAALNETLGALKNQMDADSKAKDQLMTVNVGMERTVGELTGKLNDLQGQLAAALQQNRALEEANQAQRSRAQDQIRDLERSLRELTECVMSKMQECNVAREQQMSLKSEIDSYKTLLAEEEKRLTSGFEVPSSSYTSSCVTTTSQHLPLTSRQALPPSVLRNSFCGPSTNAHGANGSPRNMPFKQQTMSMMSPRTNYCEPQKISAAFNPQQCTTTSWQGQVSNSYGQTPFGSVPYNRAMNGYTAYRQTIQRPRTAFSFH